MTRWTKLAPLAGLVAALAIGLAFTTGATLNDDEPQQARVGQKAPDFTLSDHEGNDVSLSDFEGQVIVLEWWNNECPYVVKFYREGHMQKWSKEYQEKDVVWLAINSTYNHDNGHNKRWVGQWDMPHPLLNDQSGDTARLYGARATPHMYVIDKEGTLVYAGAIDSNRSPRTQDIEDAENYTIKALDEVLNGETVSNSETRAYGCTIKYAPN